MEVNGILLNSINSILYLDIYLLITGKDIYLFRHSDNLLLHVRIIL